MKKDLLVKIIIAVVVFAGLGYFVFTNSVSKEKDLVFEARIKEVTVNDSLGLMGSTGKSTGPHLHIAVADCALFDPNDTNCSDLNKWFRYVNGRLSQNYYGLGVHIYVPDSWESR